MFLFALLSVFQPSRGEDLKVVHLVPAGGIEKGLLAELALGLREKLGVVAEVGAATDIPAEAFNPRRNQYYSTEILRTLEESKPRGGLYLLGVTGLDLYVPTLNFVFGEALPAKNVAIISIHRLRSEFYGGEPDGAVLMERMIKEAVHELGHLWGMKHCDDPGCVMFFSNSLMDTDKKSDRFCNRCQNVLKRDAQ